MKIINVNLMRKWSQDVFSTTKRGSTNARIFDTGEKNVQRQHMELLNMLSGLQRKIDRDIGSM